MISHFIMKMLMHGAGPSHKRLSLLVVSRIVGFLHPYYAGGLIVGFLLRGAVWRNHLEIWWTPRFIIEDVSRHSGGQLAQAARAPHSRRSHHARAASPAPHARRPRGGDVDDLRLILLEGLHGSSGSLCCGRRRCAVSRRSESVWGVELDGGTRSRPAAGGACVADAAAC